MEGPSPEPGSARSRVSPRESPWNGEDLDGRTLLLHSTGDTRDAVRLLRYARPAQQRGGRIVFEGTNELATIAALCPSIDQVVSQADLANRAIPIDSRCTLEDLPMILGRDPATVTAGLPYLRLPGSGPQRHIAGTTLRVAWMVNETAEPIEAMHRAEVMFVRFETSEARAPNQKVLHDWSQRAAWLAELELLITGDTLEAQVAAALGVSVWMVLSGDAGPPWLESESTLWHPTLRVFRDSAVDVLTNVRTELNAAVDQQFRLRTPHRYAEHAWQKPTGAYHDRPAISVVMPVWNAGQYLARALDSLRNQSCDNWELLAVDDGSTDGSWDILQQAARNDARIFPFRLDRNSGPAAARNVGLRAARGAWIAYLDSDDEFDPRHLARIARQPIDGDVILYAYDVRSESKEGLAPVVSTWDPIFKRDRMGIRNPATPLGVVHRRELLDHVGLFDERITYQEDWDLWQRMACAGALFRFSPERSGCYHLRADGQSRTRRTPDALK